MKKKFVWLFSAAFAATVLLSSCSVGDRPQSSGGNSASGIQRPEGKRIVVYAGGSSEFSWVAGSKEKEIIGYIEDAYYNDTGISLDFDIAYLGEDMQTKLASELAAGSQVDVVISHTRGGNGVDDKLGGEGRIIICSTRFTITRPTF